MATATYYKLYFDNITGVTAAQHKGVVKEVTDRVPAFLLRGLPFYKKIFVTLTAFNVTDEESTAATENSFALALLGD